MRTNHCEFNRVCVAPWKSQYIQANSVTSLLYWYKKFEWIDKNWTFMPVGASKNTNKQEVRSNDVFPSRKNNQLFLIKDCKVNLSKCFTDTSCGNLTVVLDSGIFQPLLKMQLPCQKSWILW